MDKFNIDKVKLESCNIADENFEKLASLFPNVVTEIIVNDRVERVIDVDKLKQEINSHVVEGLEERYNFTWPDKRKSVVLANAPTRNTLRACKEESKDFDKTENLYIEGDNLEVLKLLRNTYLGQVKMIYIDPPYNTGKDFVYQDNFYIEKEDYLENSGQFDEEGNRLFENTEANGRFHTDWLNMMYPRLKMARDLLTDDGVIFISIDDNEVSNLRKICDEIFGSRNIDILIWQKTDPWVDRNTNAKYVSRFLEFKEYIIIAYKNKNITSFNQIMRTPDWKYQQRNIDNDNRGNWQSGIFSYQEGHVNEDKTSKSYFEIITPSGKRYKRHWFCDNYDEYVKLLNDNMLYFGQNGDSAPRRKIFEEIEKPFYLTSIMRGLGTSSSAKDEIRDIYAIRELFDTPKPSKLIKEIIRASSNKDSIILDFFSGSATTAHAVMQLNAEDGGNRKYIMVQLPAETPEDSEARKAGYNTICEIGKERIRRAGEKIKKDYPNANIDTGFRVFKLDSSNMEDVYYEAEKISQQDISKTISYIKTDRSNEDLLFQIILSFGIKLTCNIEIKKVNNRDVYFVDDTYLLVCFEKDIDEKTIEELAKLKPEIMVFNQNVQDSTLANIEQIFKMLSSDTNIKVI